MILKDQLQIPVIVAPMFLVSGPALVLAACGEGLMGSFPAHATRTRQILEDWLDEIERGHAALKAANPHARIAPYAVNLVTHETNPRMAGDLEACERRRVPVVLTSKSAPREVVVRVHAYGGIVLHGVATIRHAEKALEAGVDGLICVSQGAGGHTGSIGPFGLVNEVRRIWNGPIVLAGGMTTGRDVLAAEAMGADFAYLGTRFIATDEALAPDAYKQMLLRANASELFYSTAVDGAPSTGSPKACSRQVPISMCWPPPRGARSALRRKSPANGATSGRPATASATSRISSPPPRSAAA